MLQFMQEHVLPPFWIMVAYFIGKAVQRHQIREREDKLLPYRWECQTCKAKNNGSKKTKFEFKVSANTIPDLVEIVTKHEVWHMEMGK